MGISNPVVNGRVLNNNACKLLNTDGRTLENNTHERSVIDWGITYSSRCMCAVICG